MASGVDCHSGHGVVWAVDRLERRGKGWDAPGPFEDGFYDALDGGAHALLDGEPALGSEGVQAMADVVELLVRQLLRVTAHGVCVLTHASAAFSKLGSRGVAGLGCGGRPTTVKPVNISAIPTSWPR